MWLILTPERRRGASTQEASDDPPKAVSLWSSACIRSRYPHKIREQRDLANGRPDRPDRPNLVDEPLDCIELFGQRWTGVRTTHPVIGRFGR